MPVRKNLKYAKRWLRRNFPTHYPVRIYCVKQSTILRELKHSEDYEAEQCEYEGVCFYYDKHRKHFKILLDKGLSEEKKITCLFHEYAHALRDHVPEDVSYDSHDELWKTYYARITRKWAGDD